MKLLLQISSDNDYNKNYTPWCNDYNLWGPNFLRDDIVWWRDQWRQ